MVKNWDEFSLLVCFQGTEEVDTAPGAPQQRSQLESHAHQTEIKELQRRFRQSDVAWRTGSRRSV